MQGRGTVTISLCTKNGTGADETMFSFEYSVPIPGKGSDARVLEGDGDIEHPSGLNWYHSHLHGRSSDQVMGGLSGLLILWVMTKPTWWHVAATRPIRVEGQPFWTSQR